MTADSDVLDTQIRTTAYTVSAVPEDVGTEAHLWDVTVEYRGKGRWAVKHLSSCYDAEGIPDWEPIPSSREDDWLDRFRFSDVDQALAVARKVAVELSVNGWTAARYLAEHADG